MVRVEVRQSLTGYTFARQSGNGRPQYKGACRVTGSGIDGEECVWFTRIDRGCLGCQEKLELKLTMRAGHGGLASMI